MNKELPVLWKHQRSAIERAKLKNNFAFFLGVGTGKSRTMIETLKHKYMMAGCIQRTLIFAPPVVCNVWREEFKKYSDITEVCILRGSAIKRLQTFKSSTYKIFVSNYEALLMGDLFKAFLDFNPEVVIWDESHKLKNPQAKRSKRAETLCNPNYKDKSQPRPQVYLLSGSPVLSDARDLFQQFLVMDGGDTFGRNPYAFQARYFRDYNAYMPKQKHFPDWRPKTLAKDGLDALAEITEKMAPISVRAEKEDCLDLPPELDVEIKVEMSQQQRRLYEDMKKDLITYLDSKACVATMALTKALRLLQICSGFVSVQESGEENEIIELKQTPRRDALKQLLEEYASSQKIVVWSVFRANYETIREVCKELGLQYAELHGDVSAHEKDESVKRFNEDPACRVIIGHPGAGGIGVSLVAGSIDIWYSRSFSLEHWIQARARIHRGGSKEAGHKKITHFQIVCENSFESNVTKMLAEKINLSDKLLKSLIV